MELKGRIFNIQRFSLNDGTGIRTLVFMKGCPLRCKWCANPEGMSPFQTISFNPQKCFGCGRCIEVCPQKAIYAENGEIKWNTDRCKDCFKCASVCVPQARRVLGKEYTIGELLREVEKDSVFYSLSNGGVTFSGGEPLLQTDFVSEAMRCIRDECGFTTAIETSAYAPWDRAKKVFDNVDQFNIDIKHMDPDKHKELTGVYNHCILENIQQISQTYDFTERSLVIRVPVIPGLNSDDENILATGRFVRDLACNARLELLPYHNFGESKYEIIKGEPYSLSYLSPSAPDTLMHHLLDLLREERIDVRINR